ncbi:rho GTPase-activating protein 42 [Cricetulus griseus]|uniref:Rho GTPase-activating protein 42 n=1 Tax=Cricetulus griseus TaxID=10029 RepID=A0A061I8C0_CRIGR|nr:rho GTPase-activating protein 42 [Cricetulus griseus]
MVSMQPWASSPGLYKCGDDVYNLITKAIEPGDQKFKVILNYKIQNANDVLIAPLEKFRKEQIGAAKIACYKAGVPLKTKQQSSPE